MTLFLAPVTEEKNDSEETSAFHANSLSLGDALLLNLEAQNLSNLVWHCIFGEVKYHWKTPLGKEECFLFSWVRHSATALSYQFINNGHHAAGIWTHRVEHLVNIEKPVIYGVVMIYGSFCTCATHKIVLACWTECIEVPRALPFYCRWSGSRNEK